MPSYLDEHECFSGSCTEIVVGRYYCHRHETVKKTSTLEEMRLAARAGDKIWKNGARVNLTPGERLYLLERDRLGHGVGISHGNPRPEPVDAVHHEA